MILSKAFIVLSLLFVSIQGVASSHNLTSQAFGSFLGLFSLEYSYRFSNFNTLGLMGIKGTGKLDSLEMTGSSYGLVYRHYFLPALESSSWYVMATLEKRNFQFTVRDQQKEYTAENRNAVSSAGIGYHWFWQSFNISLGMLLTDQSSLELKSESGEVYKNKWDQGIGLDFTIGGKF